MKKYIILILFFAIIYNSYAQSLYTKNLEPKHIQKTSESDVVTKAFVISPFIGLSNTSTFGVDLGFGVKHEMASGGGGGTHLIQGGVGYMQNFINKQHYMQVYAEFDYMLLVCLPPPSLSLRIGYANGYMFGTKEQYIIPEIGYHLVYGDLSMSFPIALQKERNLFISFNIRGHIFVYPKKWKKTNNN